MLSTQKNPRSSNAFVAEVIPDPLNPVMITISRPCELLVFFDIKCAVSAEPNLTEDFPFLQIPFARRTSSTKEKRGATTERAPPFPLSSGSLRLDQTKVTILPFIKHADTIRFSISKHNKVIIAV